MRHSRHRHRAWDDCSSSSGAGGRSKHQQWELPCSSSQLMGLLHWGQWWVRGSRDWLLISRALAGEVNAWLALNYAPDTPLKPIYAVADKRSSACMLLYACRRMPRDNRRGIRTHARRCAKAGGFAERGKGGRGPLQRSERRPGLQERVWRPGGWSGYDGCLPDRG